MKRSLFLYLALLLASPYAVGQEKLDTLVVKTDKSDRNVMLNAETATVPRELNIGLPESGNGAVVLVDDAKHAWGLPRGHFHWAGGNAYRRTRAMDLIESAIVTGEIGMPVNSFTRLGGEAYSGAFSLGSSTNGLIRFDGFFSGPVNKEKGWFFSAGAYVNFDPTSVNAPGRTFVDQKQIYQFAITKRWKAAELSLMYRFSMCGDNVSKAYAVAPFVYNGDGSISAYGDFNIGRNCFFPADDRVEYMDAVTGKMKSANLGQSDKRYLHDVTARGLYHLESGWDLTGTLHLCRMSPSSAALITLAGTDNVSADKGYTVAGKSYEGLVQNRLAKMEDQNTTDLEFVASAEKKTRTNDLRLGANFVFADQYYAASSFQFAHTVDAAPQRIMRNGASTWAYNKGAMYLDATKFLAVLWAVDTWRPTDRLTLRGGLRLRYSFNNIWTAAKLDGQKKNTHVEGFYINNPEMCELNLLHPNGFDYGGSAHVSYRIAGRLFALAEGFASMTNKSSSYFKNATIPSLEPIGNALGRGGLAYDNEFMDVTALVSYITSWNNALLMNVTGKDAQGNSQTIPWTAQYGIGTLGMTLDGNVHFGGFKMHLLCTWQDPRYKNYTNEFEFGDGVVKRIDYTGKIVTGISQWQLEIDPSYSWKWLRVWASARYFSKQYASRNNFAYFNGHWETFAGFDLDFKKVGKFSLNFVNVLGQNGVKGSIDTADTVQSADELKGIVMAGTFIRPFSVELSYTYKF